MLSRFLLIAVCAAPLAALPSPASAGGPGAEVVRVHGKVWIKPLMRRCEYYRPAGGGRMRAEPIRGIGRWRRMKTGELSGVFMIRTGARSWIHLGARAACIDANSLITIQSNCGYQITVLRGRVTAVDGRAGKSLGTQLVCSDPKSGNLISADERQPR